MIEEERTVQFDDAGFRLPTPKLTGAARYLKLWASESSAKELRIQRTVCGRNGPNRSGLELRCQLLLRWGEWGRWGGMACSSGIAASGHCLGRPRCRFLPSPRHE